MLVRRPSLVIALALTAALLPAAAAQAATVTNTNDNGPGSLRQAIAEAEPGATVSVPSGTYSLESELRIEKTLLLTGAGAASTVIRETGNQRVIAVEAPKFGARVTISGVTIRDGQVVAPGGVAAGAGVFDEHESLTLESDVITGNIADASGSGEQGGGISEGAGVGADHGTLTIVGSQIVGNTGLSRGGKKDGGGIARGAGISVLDTSFSISGSTISGNHLDASGGPAKGDGGIAEGGGVYLEAPEVASSIANSTVSGNTLESAGGPGGVSGVSEGGGIEGSAGMLPLKFTQLTIAGNVATAGPKGIAEGGGIDVDTPAGGSFAIVSSTIAGNAAVGPEASYLAAGNLYTSGVATIFDSIVSGGLGPAVTANCKESPLQPKSLGFNLESGVTCGFNSPADIVGADPQLGSLQDNGGPVQTMLPALTSPVIDKGSAPGLTADARGVVRPIDFPALENSIVAGADGSDIGATELQPSGEFSFGKLTKLKRKGMASLIVKLPQYTFGTLALSGKGLKARTASVNGSVAQLHLRVATTGSTHKALVKKGKRKVAITLTYTPYGSPSTAMVLKATLIKTAKHRRHGAKGHGHSQSGR